MLDHTWDFSTLLIVFLCTDDQQLARRNFQEKHSKGSLGGQWWSLVRRPLFLAYYLLDRYYEFSKCT